MESVADYFMIPGRGSPIEYSNIKKLVKYYKKQKPKLLWAFVFGGERGIIS
ncbi:hypothetical protein [Sphingobacterium sp. IITKGP-BTPF85]|uniref:hypothetical protein n=1 Tax=Sphingobacterium sp. IITKGP-BTPF85 TaxID=1338009 RepID=UPI0004145E39|nr:hypothetical protein [Sphingobacterium sp. IITKGP-BTPF85]